MKKPITIGVIAVIATILVTSAVDYSAIADKPTNPIRIQTSTSNNDGHLSCPNGTVTETVIGDFQYIVHQENGQRGLIIIRDLGFLNFNAALWSAEINSKQFTISGIGTLQSLEQFCGLPLSDGSELLRIWGECGNNAIVHYETESGVEGSFTGKVLCA